MQEEDDLKNLKEEYVLLQRQCADLKNQAKFDRGSLEEAILREKEAQLKVADEHRRAKKLERKLEEAIDMIATLAFSNSILRDQLSKAQKELAVLKKSSEKSIDSPCQKIR